MTDWNYKKGDWVKLKKELDQGLKKWSNARHWSFTSIELKIEQFLNELNIALTSAIPPKKCKRLFKYPPWWDENLTLMRSKLCKYAKNKSIDGKIAYSSLRRDYKKAIKTAKAEGWKKFTSKIKFPSDVSKLIKSFNNSKNNALGLLKKQGDYSDTPEESLSILLNKFFPGHTMVPEDDSMDCSVVKNSRLDKTFMIKKVKAAFRHMGAFKSAGPDGIKPIVMKHFGPRALGCITNIYQAIYSTGYIPTEFRKSRVVFIPKPQKDDYGEAGSFRPISLTQYLFKTMERVIEWSLREHSDDYGQISDMQHAYSGTKGTDTALSTLVNMIESAILRKHLCLVISVDIQGAFNNLATQAIHKVMVDNNYPPFMIRWYMNFLKTRISIAEVLGVKLSIRPVCGTPQGGVLSSRIWNLAFDPLLKLLNQNSPCAPVGFADDGALCFRGICADTLVDMAQPKIDQAIEWGAQNGLFFSR